MVMDWYLHGTDKCESTLLRLQVPQSQRASHSQDRSSRTVEVGMYDRLDRDYRVRGEEERKSSSDWGMRCFWYFGTLVVHGTCVPVCLTYMYLPTAPAPSIIPFIHTTPRER